MERRAPTTPELNREQDLGRDARSPARWERSGGCLAHDRKRHRPGSPLRRRLKMGTQSEALGGTPRFWPRSRWNTGGGRSRSGFSSKIHLRANAQGLPIGIILSSGEAHDSTADVDLVEERDSDPGILLADRGYDSDAITPSGRTHATARQTPTFQPREVGGSSIPSIALSTHCVIVSSSASTDPRTAVGSPPDTIKPPAASSGSLSSPQSASGSGLSTHPG